MIHIDNLDGEGTIFMSTDEGTQSIGHVEKEYASILQDVLESYDWHIKEVKRLREELFDTHAFYSNMEQKLAFAVGIKQGLLPSLSMDDLVDSMNRDYHDRLNERMNGRLKKND